MKITIYILTVSAFILFHTLMSAAGSKETVRAKDFGDRWPFTVSEGVIECTPYGERLHILTFTADGKTYGLNGTARNLTRQRGYAEIRDIWKDDPIGGGAKINIGPIIDKGLSLCGDE